MGLSRASKQYLGVRALLPPDLQIAKRAPTSTDVAYVRGTLWLDTVDLTTFMYSGASGVWISLGTGATGGVVTINSLAPSGGNIVIAGTTNQVAIANAGHTVTLSVPSTFIAPGSIASTTTITSGSTVVATTTITAGTGITSTTGNIVATAGAVNAGTSMTATLGNITATNGNVVLGTLGNKIIIPTGTNASVGTSAAMSGSPGAVTVATTASSTTAKIFFSRNVTGGTPGQVSITAQDGTGFTLTSTGNETSTFNWWIINA